jgi:predicted RNA binding protein YcfA (HicA-like mRNA interferase family)
MKYSELFRLLKESGWFILRQSGSHVVMAHPEKPNKIVIPFHASKEVKKGLLSSILKDADIKTKKR